MVGLASEDSGCAGATPPRRSSAWVYLRRPLILDDAEAETVRSVVQDEGTGLVLNECGELLRAGRERGKRIGIDEEQGAGSRARCIGGAAGCPVRVLDEPRIGK